MVIHVRPYSRSRSLAKIDGRTREARFLKAARAELIEHIGGRPSVTERALIERAVWLLLRMELLNGRLTGGDSFTHHDQLGYLGWSNALGRCLRELGLKPRTEAPSSLAQYIAARKAGTKGA